MKIITSIFLFSLPFIVFGQAHNHDHCGNAHTVQEYLNSKIGHREEEALRSFTKQLKQANQFNKSQRRAEQHYVIPVVFHVFHDGGAAVVTQAQLQSALDRANEDFNMLNDDINSIDPNFDARKDGFHVTFTLAKIDPNGQATSGIVYYPEKTGFGDINLNADIAAHAWDNYKYCNIYVQEDLYSDGDIYNSGVAWYPDSWMSDNGIARIVYNHRYLGSTGSSVADKEFQSTFSHEFGHWLNLRHVFDGNDCNSVGDDVDDTPATDVAGAGCNATRCGGLINGENYMDYNTSCYKMFTEGQVERMLIALEHPSRKPIWQIDNLVSTGVIDEYEGIIDQPFLAYSASTLKESVDNDGSLETVVQITLTEAQFITPQTLSENTHYTINGIPAGLTAQVTILDATHATLQFTGNALEHAENDNITNLEFSFTNNAIDGESISNIDNATPTFSIEYIDPYTIVYVDIDDQSVDATSNWNGFYINDDIYFGLWVYNSDEFKIEIYDDQMSVVNNTNDAFDHPYLDWIDPNDNWSQYDAFPNQHDIYNSSYSNWLGKEAYVGFRVARGTDFIYGWMRIEINATGTEMTLKDFAYNTRPNGPIRAGSTNDDVVAQINEAGLPLPVHVYPNPASEQLTVELEGKQKAELILTHLDGREVLHTVLIRKENHIPLNHIQAGIYLLQIHGKDADYHKKITLK